jgi:hypothetical protein
LGERKRERMKKWKLGMDERDDHREVRILILFDRERYD